jgi:Tfp pilus assembly protein PilN
MTNKSINLLKPDEFASAEKKRIFFLKIGTIFFIVFYCLFVVAIFSFWLVTRREFQVVSQNIETQKTKLANLQEIESLQFFLKQRLSSLAEIIDEEKKPPEDWLVYLDELVPEGTSLQDIQWTPDGKILLEGMASNALAISSYLDNLKKATDEGKIVSSTLLTANRQEEGVYVFNLEILVE